MDCRICFVHDNRISHNKVFVTMSKKEKLPQVKVNWWLLILGAIGFFAGGVGMIYLGQRLFS